MNLQRQQIAAATRAMAHAEVKCLRAPFFA